MKNRKRGFSLVVLLIVLAVIAALIATITPVAMNAIKKAKATQVAQNLKTLASALENAAYVNGINTDGTIKKSGTTTGSIALADLGRDINGEEYGVAYTMTTGGTVQAVIFAKVDADKAEVEKALNSVKEATATGDDTISFTMPDSSTKTYANLSERPSGSTVSISSGTKLMYYSIEFTIY